MADYISKFQYNGTTWDMKDAEARQALASCVNNGYYDSNAKKIILRHDSTTIVQIDATDFIKDGMVSNVQVVNGYLVITFNTDAGQEPIRIPITDIFNPDNYYTKSATNGLLALKQDLIQDLAQIRQGASAGATAYQKPQGGIPLSDINANDIDGAPTHNSNKLVRSGGVQNELALGAVYDVSAHNDNATFASLSALLNAANIDTLIPTSVRKGGMSVKFVQSSDNKYVQFMYLGTEVTGTPNPFLDVNNWECINTEDSPITGSDSPISSGGVRKLVLRIKGIGTSGSSVGATNVGDYFFHSTQNTLKIVTSTSPYGTEAVEQIVGAIYITDDNYIYTWDGTNLNPVKDKAEMERALAAEKELNDKLIKLVGMGTSGTGAGVSTIGDCFYSTSQKQIKRLVSGTPSNPGWEIIPFISGAIYTCKGHLYVWDSTKEELVNEDVNDLKKCIASIVTQSLSDIVFTTTPYNKVLIPFTFINGHEYVVRIIYPNGASDKTYVQVANSEGAALINNIGTGTSTRDVSFVCTVDNGVNLGITNVTAASTATFTVIINDLNSGLFQALYVKLQNEIDIINAFMHDGETDIEFDYSSTTVGTQYSRIEYPFNFVEGHPYRVEVTCPSNTNRSYFQVRGADSALINFLSIGYGSRTFDFICDVSGGITFAMVVAEVLVQETYQVKLISLGTVDRVLPAKQNEDFMNFSQQFDMLPLYHKKAINDYMNALGQNITKDIFAFTFITDTHMRDTYNEKVGGVHGLMCVDEVVKTGLLDLNVLGGDYADTKESGTQIPLTDFWSSMNSVNRLTTGNKFERLALRGNHELKDLISKDLYYKWALSGFHNPNIVYNASDPYGYYGYIDYAHLKIRVIFLDTSLLDYRGGNTDEQLNWLINTALDFSSISDYTAIFLAHEALYPFYYAEQYASNDWGTKPAYRQLLSAFHRGSSATINGNTVDFTSQGAIPMVYIAGHGHVDMSYINSENDMDFLTILTKDSSTARDADLQANIGTIKECVFDTYLIDVDNQTVTTKRYGYGEDRSFTFD